MKDFLGTYFLGSTIVNQILLARMHLYSKMIHIHFNVPHIPENEKHITLLPPFRTNYESASEINMGCARSTLLSTHPLTSARFSIQELALMSFDGSDVLYFPVVVNDVVDSEKNTFIEYVLALRKRLKDLGIEFKETIPETYTPHITVFTSKDLRGDKFIENLIEKSKEESPIYFRSNYPTLYTKYKNGWDDLSIDPSTF